MKTYREWGKKLRSSSEAMEEFENSKNLADYDGIMSGEMLKTGSYPLKKELYTCIQSSLLIYVWAL